MENDYGEWTFNVTGSALPFEKVAEYQHAVVKARFTAEMLENYAAALGIRLFYEEFYLPRALLAEIRDPLPAAFVAVSLAQAQASLGAKAVK